MGIQKDAGELLKYIYDKYAKGSLEIATEDVITEIGWTSTRINNAIDYLGDLEVLEIEFYIGNIDGVKNFYIHGLKPKGIDLIENKNKFKTTFGFEVGIPGLKFSWAREREH